MTICSVKGQFINLHGYIHVFIGELGDNGRIWPVVEFLMASIDSVPMEGDLCSVPPCAAQTSSC